MTRQTTILGVVAIVVIVLVGAFVFWPAAVDEPVEPAATAEGGGTTGAAGTSTDDDTDSGGY